jgi:RNA polymerase-binding transcription factor DksA
VSFAGSRVCEACGRRIPGIRLSVLPTSKVIMNSRRRLSLSDSLSISYQVAMSDTAFADQRHDRF